MFYENIKEGTFLERPNRFIANVTVNGKQEVSHVKNTGRCKELLIAGATVYLEQNQKPDRKTKFSLIGVKKGDRLINMDSQAPNKLVHEWLLKGNLFPRAKVIKPESKYKNSRFDFYIEEDDRKIYMEVKGVTLEKENVALFPDAPTKRGLKHIYELCQAIEEGYEAYIFFVIQMEDVRYFTPNRETHEELAKALEYARKMGVHILAYDCRVETDFLEIKEEVQVLLKEDIDQDRLDKLVNPLLDWYDTHKRELPWRENSSPYRVWISEIMLQQTRVEAVKPYFERFINSLPEIRDLAEIDEETLLKLWEGLGYYSRARNLQKAAKMLIEEYGGDLPENYEELIKLPGVGSYTAGAIASIAHGKNVPAVDGNVLRVLSRVLASDEDILLLSVKKKMEEKLKPVIPIHRPGDFNQALMELGALICVPNGLAKCKECPLNHLCRAKELEIVQELPKKTPKKARSIEEKTVLVIKSGERVALRKRSKKGLLAGLYEFPNVEGHLSEKEVLDLVKEKSFLPIRIQKLEPSKHIFTHKEWHMIAYVIKVEEIEEDILLEQEKTVADDNYFFIKAKEIANDFPIPKAFHAYAKYMNIKLGKENIKEINKRK